MASREVNVFVMVDPEVDATCEANVEVTKMTHEANQEAKKVNL